MFCTLHESLIARSITACCLQHALLSALAWAATVCLHMQRRRRAGVLLRLLLLQLQQPPSTPPTLLCCMQSWHTAGFHAACCSSQSRQSHTCANAAFLLLLLFCPAGQVPDQGGEFIQDPLCSSVTSFLSQPDIRSAPASACRRLPPARALTPCMLLLLLWGFLPCCCCLSLPFLPHMHSPSTMCAGCAACSPRKPSQDTTWHSSTVSC